MKLSSGSIHIDAVKKAYKEDCLVLRIHECKGARKAVTISSDYSMSAYASCNLLEDNISNIVGGSVIQTVIKPFEIKTFKLWFDK